MVKQRLPLDEYLSSRIDKNDDGHWYWLGTIQVANATGRGGGGYGVVVHHTIGKAFAHRLLYELHVGAIPVGYQIDHLCRVRRCVNPAHLEAVTQRENILRSNAPSAVNAAKETCVRGHPLSGDNLRVRTDGYRRCRACAIADSRRRYDEIRVGKRVAS